MAQIPQLHVRIVPWVNRSEVRRVYEELYSDDILRQKHALGRIDVWKSRSLHKLPLAMESTASLIQVMLEHQRAGLAVEDDRHLRTLYSMALLRFVNHVTEKGQAKVHAQPVHLLAEKVGVPEWIVDLRHEATHGSLPSLSMLRTAADWALQWLKTEFWEVQKEGSFRQELQNTTDTDTKLATLRDLLVIFQRGRFMDMKEQTNTDITDLIKDLDTIFYDLRGEIYDCLIEDGYLIFTEEQLSALEIDVKELLEDKSLIIPQKIQNFWKPVERLLDKHDLLSGFLLNLASSITSEISLRNWQLCGWIVKLSPTDKKKGYYDDKITVKDRLCFRRLLKKCALMESPYSAQLVKSLTERVGAKFLSEEKKNLLQKLSTIYFEGAAGGDVDAADNFKSVKDILVIQGGDGEDSLQESLDNPWKLCTEVDDWSKYPLGMLPSQKVSFKSLELFTDGDSIDEDETMETENIPDDLCEKICPDILEDQCETTDPSMAEDNLIEEAGLIEETHQHTSSSTSDWDAQTLAYIRQNIQLVGS